MAQASVQTIDRSRADLREPPVSPTPHAHPVTALSTPLPGDTVPTMFWNGVRLRAGKTMLREKEFGIWKSVSWTKAGQVAREIGMGMVALGFEPGETASILANTVKEWLFADLGILGAGGVSSGIYPTDAAAQVEYLINDSDSKFLFVEGDEQLDKALEVRANMPGVRKIIVFDMEGLHDLRDEQVISLERLREIGRDFDRRQPMLWDERLHARQPEDLAILIYTSGTTGKPKGAMLSHANVIAAVRGYVEAMPQGEDDERMAFLPMCHVGERIMGVYFSLFTGTRLNFVENPDTVPENVREIAPTIFAAVPRIWEKFYSMVTIKVAEATPLEQWAYRKAIAIGTQVSELRLDGKKPPLGLALLYRVVRALVLTNVRKLIGIHRARYLLTGAAPISPELVRWYLALGVEMRELWGQTECACMTTVMPPGRIKPGTVGRAPSWAEVAVSPEGELLVRGPHVFMGYLNQPEKTAETVRDGWLYTGDVGGIDADGFVKITDRMKDIIITAGGKNITPSEWENQLKFSPYITDAVVIGDKRHFLTCLVMIDHENVEKFAQDNAIPFSNYTSLCRSEQVQVLIQREIDSVNAKFARVEQIKKFRLIEQKLTVEDEELTPTMKLKRKLVNEKYRELIESMYR